MDFVSVLNPPLFPPSTTETVARRVVVIRLQNFVSIVEESGVLDGKNSKLAHVAFGACVLWVCPCVSVSVFDVLRRNSHSFHRFSSPLCGGPQLVQQLLLWTTPAQP